MANDYVTKADVTRDYRVDSRITIGQPYKPISSNVCLDNDKVAISGVRMNATIWPSGT